MKLAAPAEDKSRQRIWRRYFVGKRAEFFHCGYTVLDRYAVALKIPREVFYVLVQPVSLELLQAMLDLEMATFSRKQVKKDEKTKICGIL